MVRSLVRCGLVLNGRLYDGSALVWAPGETADALAESPMFAPHHPLPNVESWPESPPWAWGCAFFVADRSLSLGDLRGKGMQYRLLLGEGYGYSLDRVCYVVTTNGITLGFTSSDEPPVPLGA